MKICLAQTKPIKGDIRKNLENHNYLIEMALPYDIDVIVFPELSVTGYEPELAMELAACQDDDIFDHLQSTSDKYGVTIGVGMPTRCDEKVAISMLLFQPGKVRQTYSKKYIHADEEVHFVSKENFTGLIGPENNIAPAICYEISVEQHAKDAALKGAEYYLASVVKSRTSLQKSYQRLSDIAREFGMVTMMANCIGTTGDYDCPGSSAVWNRDGILMGQLNENEEGILILNTNNNELISKYMT